MAGLRRDPLSNHWVILAPERKRKPNVANRKKTSPAPESTHPLCPFCPGNEHFTNPSIYQNSGDSKNWQVRVFANKVPALRIEGSLEKKGEGMYDYINGIGAHELIVNSNYHAISLAQIPLQNFQNLLSAYQMRIKDLYNDHRLLSFQIFHNHGIETGAFYDHSLSQIIASPALPQPANQLIGSMRDHFLQKQRCLVCDILRENQDSRKRIVLENDDFLVFAPYASRFPFELQLTPKWHQHDFALLPENKLNALAQIFQESLIRLHYALDNPSFQFFIHSTPNPHRLSMLEKGESLPIFFHWYIEIIPRLQSAVGIDTLNGTYINPYLPEEIAPFLKNINIMEHYLPK